MNKLKLKSTLILFLMLISLFTYSIFPRNDGEIVGSSEKIDFKGINNKIEPKSSNLIYDTTWNNITVISDGYNGDWGWNNDTSSVPDIAIDSLGDLHLVWQDDTNGIWGTDIEIMYAKYSFSTGQLSNATVISDGYGGVWGWNNDTSQNPAILVDNSDNIHVVWNDATNGEWGTDIEIMYLNYSAATGQWSNITVISDGYGSWNNGDSTQPELSIDSIGNLHVVWQDGTDGIWGIGDDIEIMYANYSVVTGQWSDVSVISDGYKGIYWNNGSTSSLFTFKPGIAVDDADTLHVVWTDTTPGIWTDGALDYEVMYANYSVLTGWSNATVISDGFAGNYWNTGFCGPPDIVVDSSNNLHVIWTDTTPGIWGSDWEVFYVNYSDSIGWSNITVISDGFAGSYWNNGNSRVPKIAIDNADNLHVVWYDSTSGKWGIDSEIMYVKYSFSTGQWSNATVISDGYGENWGWNNDISQNPMISVDIIGNAHVVWDDATNGLWGIDTEIMYASNILPVAPNLIQNRVFNISSSWDDATSAVTFTDYTSTDLSLGGNTNEGNSAQRRTVLRWNLSIPHNARIINAYINLTVNTLQSWTSGFTAIIQAFSLPNTPPFNNTVENIANRPKVPGQAQAPQWALTGTYAQYSVIKSPNIASIMQPIINNAYWINNSYFGVYIRPYSGVSTNEMLRTYAIDAGFQNYIPKLYVEWEESPYFTKIPTDLTIRNNTFGYYVSWIAKDNNPSNYIIFKNIFEVVSQGFWTSGLEIRYNVPKLGIGVYNYTLLIYDLDGNYDINSVTINCTNLDKPIITKIELIQNSEIFSINKKDCFICGDGPFTLKIYNNTPINLQIELSAYYKNYNNTLFVVSDALGAPTTIPVVLDPYTINTFTYNLNYSNSIDSFLFSPPTNDQYQWKIVASLGTLELLKEIVKKNVSSIEYNVLNYFTFDINDGDEYIYNETIYGGIWGNYWIEVLNKDLTPPNYGDPEVDKPNDSSSNFEVEINTYDEPYGSGIKTVTLFYSVDNGPWKEIEMLLTEGKYRCGISPQSEGAKIRYYIEISDLAGNFIETDEEKITAPTFEDDPLINPIIGIASGAIGALVIILSTKYYYNKKRSGASPKKFEKSSKKTDKPTYDLWMLKEDD